MNVAIYARVSSDRQAEKEISIPAQVKAIQQYCQERGYTVVQEFIEKGKSAKTDDREEFQKMIALAKRSSRSFDAILVHKFDRFSRKRDDHVIYKALLAQVGVKVISVTEQTDADTPQDKLLEGILEVMSEFFNANLAAEVRKGMKQNAKMGFNNGGTAPYGYRTEHMALAHQKTKAVWVLGRQQEIEIIRWIFNQYAYEGMGYTKIAAELNRQQIPTQKGGTWSASTIRAIIFNESYMGRRCWNKQDYQTKGKKWRDRSEWIITENAHPAIITKELFEKCQIVAKERHKGGGETHKPVDMRAASPFWLRGVMICDKCGSPMVGNSTSSKMKGGRKQYYVCGGYMRKGKDFCSYAGWNKNRVEEIVSSRLRLMFMQLLIQDGLEQEIKKNFNESNQHKLAAKQNMENEVSFLLKRISLIQEDIQAGKAKFYHHEMLSEMESDLQNKTKELQAHSESWSEVAVPEELIASIKYDLQAFLSLLDQEVPNVQLLHTIAKKFISRLCINRDTGKLYLTLRLLHEQSVIYEKTLVAEWK
ncbi:recombinase family protein [Saccharibacillus qingshengii]|uniref:recombinase family protein n=1 Tax=Saccharibacillus qingshengii TaxID=1763540 RepID=UPI00155365A2|nr:recombinase family protein [Saccharibacillus qingshengii]